MRAWLSAILLLLVSAGVSAADQIAEARRLYNAGEYEAAARTAREAAEVQAIADEARVVLARSQLEIYRQSALHEDLIAARDALREIDPQNLESRTRLELLLGFAEALYYEDRFGAAAELFESLLDPSHLLGRVAHERVLDWWATALDRQAQSRPPESRPTIYERVLQRMRHEINQDQGSTPASYWLAAAARGSGDLDQAWWAAIAGWVRATLAEDRGAALRADLDRLMTQAIIPERAGKLQLRDAPQVQSGMQNEWESLKANWSK